jgi:tetratricopeptide (TPR) repeat protein
MKKLERDTRYGAAIPLNPAKNMSTQLEESLEDSFFEQNLSQYYREILKQFRKITHSFVSFNVAFFLLFLVEIVLFCSFFSVLSKSAFIALACGGIFLTCFSYFMLLFYYQARKPELLHSLKDQFIQSCRQMLSIPEGEAQHHLSIAEALSKLAIYLQDFEFNFYKVPSFLSWGSRAISRFSSYCYGEDVFTMKLLLLHAAVSEHLKQISYTPTDLEVHASLANTYVELSKVYKQVPEFEDKFRATNKLAVEEFSILSHYAPNDPWVHEQLAAGYRDLGMPEEEMREIETLIKLRPQDKEILYRLGALYFKQGLNAKGLQTYEELKKANYKKAEDLISFYGALPFA